jgi:hypothetical protein
MLACEGRRCWRRFLEWKLLACRTQARRASWHVHASRVISRTCGSSAWPVDRRSHRTGTERRTRCCTCPMGRASSRPQRARRSADYIRRTHILLDSATVLLEASRALRYSDRPDVLPRALSIVLHPTVGPSRKSSDGNPMGVGATFTHRNVDIHLRTRASLTCDADANRAHDLALWC